MQKTGIKTPCPIHNLAELKRQIVPGTEIKTLSHANHPDMTGLIRVVNEVHTNCFYSFIKDQPEHKWSRCNYGKGFRTDFAKASEYEFDGDTIRLINPRTKDGSILMEFQVFPPEQKQTFAPPMIVIHPTSRMANKKNIIQPPMRTSQCRRKKPAARYLECEAPMQPIRTLDMFSGIGGFRSGLEAIGGFSFVGHCEIDKYANQAYEAIYQPKGELYFNDARKIDPYTLPDIDLICGGFPCQSFSIAGKRKGFDDTRGTLFFEIARIAKVKRPAFLLLENVPGLLSADGGRSYAAILGAMDELGYDVAWQVLNSKDFGVPQNRQRVYIVGYLRDKCAGKILSFTETNGNDLVQSIPGKQGERVYRTDGLSCTLTSCGGGFAGNTGLYEVDEFNLPIKVNTKSGYQLAHPGDSIDLAYANMNTRRG